MLFLFNVALEYITKVQEYQERLELKERHQFLVSSDDMNIVTR
jgi:hypothetical protein